MKLLEREEALKRTEKQDEVRVLLEGAVHYDEYKPTLRDLIIWFATGFLASGAVMYVFYERWYVSLVLGICGGMLFVPMSRKRLIEKRKKTLTLQFKEMLESIKSSLSSESVFDAFMKAKDDLSIQFPQDAYIMQELNLLMRGTLLKARIEDLLVDFGVRSGVEDIQNFATVFKNCYAKGGNMEEIVGRSITIINEKIEVSMDIETMVAGQKNEQNILLVLPVIFVIMLKAMGGMVDLNSATGLISMTIAIGLFLAAYGISRKIMKIDV